MEIECVVEAASPARLAMSLTGREGLGAIECVVEAILLL